MIYQVNLTTTQQYLPGLAAVMPVIQVRDHLATDATYKLYNILTSLQMQNNI